MNLETWVYVFLIIPLIYSIGWLKIETDDGAYFWKLSTAVLVGVIIYWIVKSL